jgi:hypothetical protein
MYAQATLALGIFCIIGSISYLLELYQMIFKYPATFEWLPLFTILGEDLPQIALSLVLGKTFEGEVTALAAFNIATSVYSALIKISGELLLNHCEYVCIPFQLARYTLSINCDILFSKVTVANLSLPRMMVILRWKEGVQHDNTDFHLLQGYVVKCTINNENDIYISMISKERNEHFLENSQACCTSWMIILGWQIKRCRRAVRHSSTLTER